MASNAMRPLLAQSSASNQPSTPRAGAASEAKENAPIQGKGAAMIAAPKVLAAAAAAPGTAGAATAAAAALTQDEEDHPRSWRSWRTGEQLSPWETQVLNKPDVKRKANLAQLYFLNYYFDSLRYLSDRKARATKFEQTLSEAPDMTQGEEELERSHYNGRERALLRKRRTKLRLGQFDIITQVGQGGYGEVFLARKRETQEVCALKKLKKKVLVKMDEAHHVLIERDILTATRTQWLVKLMYAFQDPEHVYLAMEYVPGGDFRTLLNKSGVLREHHARFYAAEMFVAVNELHKLGYLHRDLKPENFLVDASGHIKLTDFGLASGALNPGRIASLRQRLDQVKDTDFVYRTPLERRSLFQASRMEHVEAAKSIVGSPDYMAPEVLRAKASSTYGVGADYWSLGCILYEFLCGFPPFSGRTPDETWANLKNWKRVLQRPVYTKAEDLQFNLTDVAWDVITRLIEAPELRYQSLSEVSGHEFFKPLSFHSLRERSPPYVPQLESDIDTAHFDDFDNPEDMAKYKEVKDKQQRVEAVQGPTSSAQDRRMDRGLWVGFTFGKNGVGPNGKASSAAAGGDMSAQEAFATMF